MPTRRVHAQRMGIGGRGRLTFSLSMPVYLGFATVSLGCGRAGTDRHEPDVDVDLLPPNLLSRKKTELFEGLQVSRCSLALWDTVKFGGCASLRTPILSG